jgi:hypothetical protein
MLVGCTVVGTFTGQFPVNRGLRRSDGVGVAGDRLCSYCECVEMYLKRTEIVDSHGILVEGRTLREPVRNPAPTPGHQAHDALIRLARAVLLVDPKPVRDGAELDQFLEEIMK